MHSLAVKIISLASLFVLTFVAGVVPLKLLRRRDSNDRNLREDLRRKRLISLSICFAGGAFFASSMLELLPTVKREFQTVFKDANLKTDFPVSEFGICVGFFLILIMEQVIHVMKDKADKHPAEDSRSSHFKKGLTYTSSSDRDCREHLHSESIIVRDSGESDSDSDHSHDHKYEGHDGDHHHSDHQLGNHHHHGHHQNDHQPLHDKDDELENNSDPHEHSIVFYRNSKHQNQRHYLRSYLLLIALSVHSLFEGLAIGLFHDVDDVVELLGVLIIHKCVLAFSIGINLVQHSFPSFMVIKSSLLFSAMSPIGLGLGILLLKYTSGRLGTIFSAIFQAIATGTFLYVTFFEIFFHELNGRECHKLLKVLMMILGFSLITVVQYFDTKISPN